MSCLVYETGENGEKKCFNLNILSWISGEVWRNQKIFMFKKLESDTCDTLRQTDQSIADN